MRRLHFPTTNRKGDKVKSLFFLILLFLPLSVFAYEPFEVLEAKPYVTPHFECMAGPCNSVSNAEFTNTEIADSTTVSGGDTQTSKVTSAAKHLGKDPTDVLMVIPSEEVGWQS